MLNWSQARVKWFVFSESGAGDGNRTHVRSLGSFYTAIVRRPLVSSAPRLYITKRLCVQTDLLPNFPFDLEQRPHRIRLANLSLQTERANLSGIDKTYAFRFGLIAEQGSATLQRSMDRPWKRVEIGDDRLGVGVTHVVDVHWRAQCFPLWPNALFQDPFGFVFG